MICFLNIKLEKEGYPELEAAIDKEAQAAGLFFIETWIFLENNSSKIY